MTADLTLAIETSSLRGSVALGQGAQVLGFHALEAERKNAAELLPAIDHLLAGAARGPADIAILAFSQGPGSFTGLRVAATIARLWHAVVGCQVIGAPSLEVIARNALDQAAPRIGVMLDARGGRVFGAVYERDGDALRCVRAAGLAEPGEWLASVAPPCHVTGDGLKHHAEAVRAAGLTPLPETHWWPDARRLLEVAQVLAAAGRFLKPEDIVPAYLRPPECEEVYEERRAKARKRRGE